jgi:hypothetical protein
MNRAWNRCRSRRAFGRLAALGLALAGSLSLAACESLNQALSPAPKLADQDITDAYIYLLGRMLVVRQEQIDLGSDFKWNQVIHRQAGGVNWANPNLDIAYSEAWIAVDPSSCTLVTVPSIKDRYYTIQTLNGWGETTANINERTYPEHPSGQFALCLKGANVLLESSVQRVDLPSQKSRVLMRVELGADPAQATKLQRKITLIATGTPVIDPTFDQPNFANDSLPGVEAFDRAEALLASEPDINPGMEGLQAKLHEVVAAAADPKQRAHVDQVIHEQSIPQFHANLQTPGMTRNGWNRPATMGNYGSDYVSRSAADFASIWANNNGEVVYFKTSTDGDGTPLDGGNVYTMTFPKDQLPGSLAHYFWSVTAVDSVKFQVIENPLKRYRLNNQSKLKLNQDGSLTLVFASKRPSGVPKNNWLPTPEGESYNLTFRFYGPNQAITAGEYFPPPLVKSE